MKVALLQLCAGGNKESNCANAIAMSKEAVARKAQWILLPEVFNFRGDSREKEEFLKMREEIPGATTRAFSAFAQKHKVSFLLGSIIEKASSGRAYNTSVAIDPHGQITAKYRKMNLFDARIGKRIVRESDSFQAGRKLGRAKIGEFRAGLTICYDLRFPGLYQQYARMGVEVLTVPSCFTQKTGEAHWESLLRARAIENLSYVLAPNQTGVDARGMKAYGHSMIVSPWGEIIAQASQSKQEIVYGDIHLEEVRKARAILPGIANEIR